MGVPKINKMVRNVEDALAAATFAEAGEAETAISIMKEGRKVLLALKEGRIDAKTLKYALNTARRIDAHLDILYVNAPGESVQSFDPLIVAFEAELRAAGIPHRIVPRTGCLKQQIIDYSNSEKDILFAVIESPHTLDADCNEKDKTLSELWHKLKCPLVVVMDGARA
jgi:hypothetical protein